MKKTMVWKRAKSNINPIYLSEPKIRSTPITRERAKDECHPKVISEPLRMTNPNTPSAPVTQPTISFFVPGDPVPKQSFRYSTKGSHANPRAAAWQQLISLVAVQHSPRQPLTGDLAVNLEFITPDRRRRDLDNLAKCVFDGLNGIIWQDDSQIIELHVFKRVGQQTGVHVLVYDPQETIPASGEAVIVTPHATLELD